MNIDIATTVKVILVFLAIGGVVSIYFGFRAIRAGMHLQFFRKRHDLVLHGWNLLFLALGLGIFALIFSHFAEPVAYHYFPPSPTVTDTPTVTMTPTITETPIDTLTPTITETLQYTYTPSLPLEAQQTVQTPIGPDTSSVFSRVQFSDTLSKDGTVTEDMTSFPSTVSHIYGGYSFDGMALGVQWTAVWNLDGKPVHIETNAWKVAPGGYGYTDWDCTTGACVPGDYEVQIFVGSTWKSSGRFTITTSTSAENGTGTPTPTLTPLAPFPTATFSSLQQTPFVTMTPTPPPQ